MEVVLSEGRVRYVKKKAENSHGTGKRSHYSPFHEAFRDRTNRHYITSNPYSIGAVMGAVTSGTHSLFGKAFECIQSDVENFVAECNELTRKDIRKVENDMVLLREGMKSMQSYIEHMHRQNPLGKRKIEEMEERLKKKDEEIEQLKADLKALREHHEEQIADLEKFKVAIEEERRPAADKDIKTSQGKGNDTDGVEASNGASGSSSKQDKKFEFQDKVEGKNVMIANDIAAVSEGGPLSFLEPLKSDNPNSMLNKDSDMPMNDTTGLGSPPSDALAGIDGSFVGNEKVNVQKNVQQVFLSGPGSENIEVEDSDEKITYHQADQSELSRLIEKARDEAEDGDDEIVVLNPDEELHQKDVILRVANLLLREEKVEHFIRLCEYLNRLTPRQLRSLAPDLKQITRINLTDVQINYQLLSAFFRCFKNKRFHWLLLRNSRINAADMRLLSSSITSCKIGYLDLGGCSFEYMSFFELATVIYHVDNIILRGITSAAIVPENALSQTKPFLRDEAMQLAESILRSPKMIGVDLSSCDFSNVDVAAALSNCLPKVSNLILSYSDFSAEGVHAMFGPMNKMEKLDFACAALRNLGVQALASYFAKVNVIILSNVLLDDEGVDPLVEWLGNLPENGVEVIDLSFNPISVENISKILSTVGKVKVFIFSREQINYEVHKNHLADKIMLSEVEGRNIYRLTDSPSTGFTHWIACVTPLEETLQSKVFEAIQMSPEEQKARAVSEYRCSKCKTHIAFTKDEVQAPCPSLANDKGLLGVLENTDFKTVTRVISCIPSNAGAKKHTCTHPGCPITRFKMRGCKCAKCRQPIGGYYATRDQSQKFWCLYQESPGTNEVGTTRYACKHM